LRRPLTRAARHLCRPRSRGDSDESDASGDDASDDDSSSSDSEAAEPQARARTLTRSVVCTLGLTAAAAPTHAPRC
jgi:hypothetical protein